MRRWIHASSASEANGGHARGSYAGRAPCGMAHLNSVTVLAQEADSGSAAQVAPICLAVNDRGARRPGGGRMRGEMTGLWAVVMLGALGCSQEAAPTAASAAAARARGWAAVRGPSRSVRSAAPLSQGNSINDLGWVGGLSALAGNLTVHATIWRGQTPTRPRDARRARTARCSGRRRTMIGLVAGVAETDQDQPLGETWSCRFFFPSRTGKTCLGVVWEHGSIRALPTWGGDNGFATSANDFRQIVGWAETQVLDPSCTGRQKRQFIAALWGPGNDEMRQLPPLPGDSTSAATGINDRGQAIGISGACGIAVGGVSARRAVMWEGGSITDLGTLGGEGWNTPMALNAWGDVVGFANAPGDAGRTTSCRGRSSGPAARGSSRCRCCPGTTTVRRWASTSGGRWSASPARGAAARGVLWQRGKVIDLTSHVLTGLTGTITNAGDIDDLGRIGGQFLDSSTGATTAFRAIPAGVCHRGMHDDDQGED